MDNLFQNVNLDKLEFVNGKNDMNFFFIDSFAGQGKECGWLQCSDIVFFKMEVSADSDDLLFPQFFCDIMSEKMNLERTAALLLEKKFNSPFSSSPEKSYYSVQFLGGDYYIFLICSEINIKKGAWPQ